MKFVLLLAVVVILLLTLPTTSGFGTKNRCPGGYTYINTWFQGKKCVKCLTGYHPSFKLGGIGCYPNFTLARNSIPVPPLDVRNP